MQSNLELLPLKESHKDALLKKVLFFYDEFRSTKWKGKNVAVISPRHLEVAIQYALKRTKGKYDESIIVEELYRYKRASFEFRAHHVSIIKISKFFVNPTTPNAFE